MICARLMRAKIDPMSGSAYTERLNIDSALALLPLCQAR
jgi:hypothetical protein